MLCTSKRDFYEKKNFAVTLNFNVTMVFESVAVAHVGGFGGGVILDYTDVEVC